LGGWGAGLGGERGGTADASQRRRYAGEGEGLRPGRSGHFVVVAGDDAGAGFVDEVGPAPLEEDGEFVAEADEEEEVDEEPGGPGEDAAHLEATGLGDGAVLADDGHDAFVAVAEGGAEF